LTFCFGVRSAWRNTPTSASSTSLLSQSTKLVASSWSLCWLAERRLVAAASCGSARPATAVDGDVLPAPPESESPTEADEPVEPVEGCRASSAAVIGPGVNGIAGPLGSAPVGEVAAEEAPAAGAGVLPLPLPPRFSSSDIGANRLASDDDEEPDAAAPGDDNAALLPPPLEDLDSGTGEGEYSLSLDGESAVATRGTDEAADAAAEGESSRSGKLAVSPAVKLCGGTNGCHAGTGDEGTGLPASVLASTVRIAKPEAAPLDDAGAGGCCCCCTKRAPPVAEAAAVEEEPPAAGIGTAAVRATGPDGDDFPCCCCCCPARKDTDRAVLSPDSDRGVRSWLGELEPPVSTCSGSVLTETETPVERELGEADVECGLLVLLPPAPRSGEPSRDPVGEVVAEDAFDPDPLPLPLPSEDSPPEDRRLWCCSVEGRGGSTAGKLSASRPGLLSRHILRRMRAHLS
jgi:hypothetical protein